MNERCGMSEERMKNEEVFRYLVIWIDSRMKGNVHLEKAE